MGAVYKHRLPSPGWWGLPSLWASKPCERSTCQHQAVVSPDPTLPEPLLGLSRRRRLVPSSAVVLRSPCEQGSVFCSVPQEAGERTHPLCSMLASHCPIPFQETSVSSSGLRENQAGRRTLYLRAQAQESPTPSSNPAAPFLPVQPCSTFSTPLSLVFSTGKLRWPN